MTTLRTPAVSPLRIWLIHWYKASEPMTPRLRVTSPTFVKPGSLRVLFSLSLPFRVLDHIDAHRDPAALLKACLRSVGLARADIDKEIELSVRAVAKHGHVSLS